MSEPWSNRVSYMIGYDAWYSWDAETRLMFLMGQCGDCWDVKAPLNYYRAKAGIPEHGLRCFFVKIHPPHEVMLAQKTAIHGGNVAIVWAMWPEEARAALDKYGPSDVEFQTKTEHERLRYESMRAKAERTMGLKRRAQAKAANRLKQDASAHVHRVEDSHKCIDPSQIRTSPHGTEYASRSFTPEFYHLSVDVRLDDLDDLPDPDIPEWRRHWPKRRFYVPPEEWRRSPLQYGPRGFA